MAVTGSASALNSRSLRNSSIAASLLAVRNCTRMANRITARLPQRSSGRLLPCGFSARWRSSASRNQYQAP
jgi:hypothetical protein